MLKKLKQKNYKKNNINIEEYTLKIRQSTVLIDDLKIKKFELTNTNTQLESEFGVLSDPMMEAVQRNDDLRSQLNKLLIDNNAKKK